jgi:nicotinamidase-related amidase
MAIRPLHERSIPRVAQDALDPSTTAVLLWDLQYGLGGHALDLDRLTARWIELRDAAQETGALVVRSKHVSAPLEHLDDVELWRLMRKQRVDDPTKLQPFMRPGSHDVEFLAGLEPGPDEVVIEKTTPSLFVNTPADARLRSVGIKTLVLAGVATDIGIEFTARHAMALGYMPVIVTDAVGSYTVEAQERGLSCLHAFTLVASTAEVVEAWRARARQNGKVPF